LRAWQASRRAGCRSWIPTIARIRREPPDLIINSSGGQGGADGGQHRGQLLEVVGLLGQLGGDHHLGGRGRGLGVVALQGPAVAMDKAAVSVGGVDGRLVIGGLIPASGADMGPGPLAASVGRSSQLGDPLLIALLAGGRLGLQLGFGLLQSGQPLGPVGRGGLGEQLGDLRLEVGVGAVGRGGRVGLDLSAIQGDQAQADQAGGRAQLQRLDRQPGQGLLMSDPEPGDGHMIGGAVAAQHAEGDVLVAAPFDLAGGADPGAIGVQQHSQQHPGRIGRPAMPSAR
jgi:hypothetical protein